MIGNSRLHWAWFCSGKKSFVLCLGWVNILATVDTQQLTKCTLSEFPNKFICSCQSPEWDGNKQRRGVYLEGIIPRFRKIHAAFISGFCSSNQTALLANLSRRLHDYFRPNYRSKVYIPHWGWSDFVALWGAGGGLLIACAISDAGTGLRAWLGADANRCNWTILAGSKAQLESLSQKQPIYTI